MKTAEEWLSVCPEFVGHECGYGREITEEIVQQIQLDAFKAGMEYAAERIFPVNVKHDGTKEHKRRLNRDYNNISTAAQQLTELPK